MSILIQSAKDFAIKAHGNQMYGEFPYAKHLTDTVQALAYHREALGFGDHVLAAGWLHDTVEDTYVKAQDIYENFGKATGDVVYGVTNELGRNRRERTVKTMLKVREWGDDVLAVKLADRIANGTFSRSQASSQYQMYKQEYPFIRWFLRGKSLRPMWDQLDTIFEVKA